MPPPVYKAFNIKVEETYLFSMTIILNILIMRIILFYLLWQYCALHKEVGYFLKLKMTLLL
jgi:hypothetical protein